jgi:hypothetical protein
MQLPEAVLVFDADDSEATGEYEMYSVAPMDGAQLLRDWDNMKKGLTPTGRIPVGEVEFCETEIHVRTMGLERFAKPA